MCVNFFPASQIPKLSFFKVHNGCNSTSLGVSVLGEKEKEAESVGLSHLCTFHWKELSHMTVANCQENGKGKHFSFLPIL
jgi:hypothetical protein